MLLSHASEHYVAINFRHFETDNIDFKVGMAEIFHLFFFFARISQSLEVILIPACRFLLKSSEAKIVQCGCHVMPNTHACMDRRSHIGRHVMTGLVSFQASGLH